MTEADSIHLERILAFDKLAMELGFRRYAIVGLLTCLWELAKEPENKGTLCMSNEEVAKRLDWLNKPNQLMQALLKSGWIEESGDCPFYKVRWFGLSDTWFGAIDPEKLEGRS